MNHVIYTTKNELSMMKRNDKQFYNFKIFYETLLHLLTKIFMYFLLKKMYEARNRINIKKTFLLFYRNKGDKKLS